LTVKVMEIELFSFGMRIVDVLTICFWMQFSNSCKEKKKLLVLFSWFSSLLSSVANGDGLVDVSAHFFFSLQLGPECGYFRFETQESFSGFG